MQKKFTQAAGSECGIALVSALLSLLVLSTLTAAFIFASHTETWTTVNYKAVTQGRYLAEAGIERTLNWMRYNYTAPSESSYTTSTSPVQYSSAAAVLSGRNGVTANYPDSSAQASFYSNLHNQSLSTMGLSGTYSTSATLLEFRNVQSLYSTTPIATEMWRVTSEGSVTGAPGATVQVEAIVERRGAPIFNYGLFATGTGCGVMNMSSLLQPGVVDSWDSSKGTYATTKAQTGGDIGANGNVNISGGFNVYGTLSTPMPNQTTDSCSPGDPNALTDSSSGDVTEGKIQLPEPATYDDPPPISPAPPTTNQVVSISCASIPGCSVVGPGQFALAPGNYGNLFLFGSNRIILSAGTYNINSINLSSGALMQVDSGPVRVQVAGTGVPTPISLVGSSILNTTGVPGNLAFIYGGTGTVLLSGGSGSYAVMYAPNARVNMGRGDWYGAIVTRSFNATGGASFHFDAALRDNFFLKPAWRVISMSRNKY